MNRDDIIRMAREVKIECDLIDEDEGQVWYITTETLERFAVLVAAAEREACAEVCYRLGNDASIEDVAYETFREAEETIRARGEDKP